MLTLHPQYFSSYYHQYSRFLVILHHSCEQCTFHPIHSSVVKVVHPNISQFILTRDTGLHHCLIFRELIKWLSPDTTHCFISTTYIFKFCRHNWTKGDAHPLIFKEIFVYTSPYTNQSSHSSSRIVCCHLLSLVYYLLNYSLLYIYQY